MTDNPIGQFHRSFQDEEVLVGRLQKGDLQAFEALFKNYKNRIYSLCYRMTNDILAAEDLTQDIFLQLFKRKETFRGASSFSTWFHRLAVNIILMYLRRKPTIAEMSVAQNSDQPRKPASLDNELKVNKILLERALSELPQGYRTVLVLHDIEGYDHGEIADLVGCSVGTSKSQLHKARLKLRGILRR